MNDSWDIFTLSTCILVVFVPIAHGLRRDLREDPECAPFPALILEESKAEGEY